MICVKICYIKSHILISLLRNIRLFQQFSLKTMKSLRLLTYDNDDFETNYIWYNMKLFNRHLFKNGVNSICIIKTILKAGYFYEQNAHKITQSNNLSSFC